MRLPQKNENCQRTSDHQPSPQNRPKKAHPSVKFPKAARICSRNHYHGIKQAGNKVFGTAIGIDYRLGRALQPRLGVSVSKKYGKAHDRNRFKRLVREAFRSHYPEFPKDLEVNVFPRKNEGLSVQKIQEDFRNLCSILSSKKP